MIENESGKVCMNMQRSKKNRWGGEGVEVDFEGKLRSQSCLGGCNDRVSPQILECHAAQQTTWHTVEHATNITQSTTHSA